MVQVARGYDDARSLNHSGNKGGGKKEAFAACVCYQ